MKSDPLPRSAALRLAADRRGASAILVGLSFAVLLGFVGLGVDAGRFYLVRRTAQGAADSAAFSAAAAQLAGDPDLVGQAQAVAASDGFPNGANGVQVSLNTPPTRGGYAGAPNAVEVIISKPITAMFAGRFLQGVPVMSARAVAKFGVAGDACVVALNSTASASALDTGSTNVNLVGCSLYANSSSSSALTLKGSTTVTAASVGLVGGYSLSNNATLTTTKGVRTGQAAVVDPYLNRTIPAYSGCDFSGGSLPSGTYSNNGRPFVFCNGVSINSGATVTLSPGIYIVDRGAFQVNGGATLQGQGVTLIFTSSTGSNYATLQINGGATLNLTAPNAGPTKGLALFQDRRAPTGVQDTLNGGSTQTIQGAVYFPSQILNFSGGASTTSPGCTQLIASQVAFQGNATLGINCAGLGVNPAGGTPPALVE